MGRISLIDTVTGPAHVVDNTWEDDRDVLKTKTNRRLDESVVSQFAYTVNAIGQRTEVAMTGDALGAATGWDWGYNRRGEVVAAEHGTSSALNREYAYDAIGNRISKIEGTVTTHCNLLNNNPNADADLNQYESIQEQISGPTLLPEFDAAGNMTAGPLPVDPDENSMLGWDSENRLVSVVLADDTAITCTYDFIGRRIAKDVDGMVTRFIYDGWNLVAQYDAAWALEKTWVWGTDLSGSIQGAGGVGGLLVAREDGDSYYALYDGNGNVTEYLGENGTVVAHYEYDPFGNIGPNSGAKADAFELRFSTKFRDAETGFYYYGYRYYDPVHGRWPSRDPIGERGGVSLYRFVDNDAIRRFDRNGLQLWGPNPADWWQNNTCPDDGAPFAPLDSLPPWLGGLEGEVDQNRFFEENFPEIVEGYQELFRARISQRAEEDCCERNSTYDDIESETVLFANNFASALLEVGHATLMVETANVTWISEGKGWYSYTWEADLELHDGLGYDTGPEIMWNEEMCYNTLGSGGIGLLADRDIIRARWHLSDTNRCCCSDEE